MITKINKIAALEYAINSYKRAIKASTNEIIKGVYEQQLEDLEQWKTQIKNEK